MPAGGAVTLSVFVMVSSFVLLVCMLVLARRSRLDVRLENLSGKETGSDLKSVAQLARTALPKMGAPLLPDSEERRTRLQSRLIHAGYYHKQTMVYFLGVKMLLMVGPACLGFLVGLLGIVPILDGVIYGGLFGATGVVAPPLWLRHRKNTRQMCFRRALPDALDVLVICLEGGLSLPAGFRRVASELQTAHPMLANELNIVQREMQLGRSTGEALRQFADRADLEELRSLASVIIQAERFGASLVKALRVHADTLRVKRLQLAEEMGQKAAIKILFPTLLFIFPGIFVVVLGPAAINLFQMFAQLKQ